MIGFKLNHRFIELAKNTSLTIEAQNPLLFRDKIPGTKTFNFNALLSKQNQRDFGFAELTTIPSIVNKYENVEMFLQNIAYQKGTLKLKSIKPKEYAFNFISNAGDLSQKLGDKTISDLGFNDETVVYNTTQNYPASRYVFFPVYNPNFYGDKNQDYSGYMNYYHNGGLIANSSQVNKHTRVPFPFVLTILHKIAEEAGFTLQGTWLESNVAKKAVILNTLSLDELSAGTNVFKTNFNISNHLPNIKQSSFLIEIQILLGLYFKINSREKTIEIITIKDKINDNSYLDLSKATAKNYNDKIPNAYDGAEFIQQEDSNDEISKQSPWLRHKIGNGKMKIQTSASTVADINITDNENARNWQIPHVEISGSGDEFELGEKRGNLRIAFFDGMDQDSLGNDYPRGTYEIAETSLRWGLTNGIVNNAYQDYLAFKENTETITKEANLNLIQFLNLQIDQKILDNGVKYFIESISTDASRAGLGKSQLKLNRIFY